MFVYRYVQTYTIDTSYDTNTVQCGWNPICIVHRLDMDVRATLTSLNIDKIDITLVLL
jgi:hypothetical protein